jgi:dihydroxyacetone kinase-like protein
MKKLFNSHASMVEDMIDGFVAAYPHQVARGAAMRLIRRAQPADPANKVMLAIGNGSGHEPIAMGYVGTGLLDANIVGDVFTAPSPDLIYDALDEITGDAGTLLLVSRHEGDVINANAAVMMAEEDDLKVRALLMYDDISSAPKGSEHERRGAAGTLFIYKILGAAAETGMDLDALEALGIAVRDCTRTLAAAVSPGISPLTGAPMFALPDDEVFIGMGVHGEPGVGRRKVEPVGELVNFMMGELLDDMPIAPDQKTIALINGSGATSLMELLTIYREVEAELRRRNIPAVAPAIGSMSTTQDTQGFSISLMTPTQPMLDFWQAAQQTPFFPHIYNGETS